MRLDLVEAKGKDRFRKSPSTECGGWAHMQLPEILFAAIRTHILPSRSTSKFECTLKCCRLCPLLFA